MNKTSVRRRRAHCHAVSARRSRSATHFIAEGITRWCTLSIFVPLLSRGTQTGCGCAGTCRELAPFLGHCHTTRETRCRKVGCSMIDFAIKIHHVATTYLATTKSTDALVLSSRPLLSGMFAKDRRPVPVDDFSFASIKRNPVGNG